MSGRLLRDVSTVSDGSSGSGSGRVTGWRPVVPSGGGGALRCWQHGDPLGTAGAPDWQCCSRPDRSRQAASAGGRASGLAAGAMPVGRLHAAGVGVRVGRARTKGGLLLGPGIRAREETQLQKTSSPPSGIVRPSRGGGRSSRPASIASTPRGWCSSTRLGPRPTWRRCVAGRPVALG
jgi:hypothetical protein